MNLKVTKAQASWLLMQVASAQVNYHMSAKTQNRIKAHEEILVPLAEQLKEIINA